MMIPISQRSEIFARGSWIHSRGSWISQKFETLIAFEAATVRMLLLVASALALCLGWWAGFNVTASGIPDTAMLSAIIAIFLVFADTIQARFSKGDTKRPKSSGVRHWSRSKNAFRD